MTRNNDFAIKPCHELPSGTAPSVARLIQFFQPLEISGHTPPAAARPLTPSSLILLC